MPTYVITTELGKIPVNNAYYEKTGDEIRIRNFRGETADILRYLSLEE